MITRIGRPSPATVIALLALFVALSGTAVAAGVVPLAKRALVADNAQKLQGKTALQIAAAPSPASNASAIAAMPSPASSAAGLVAVKTAPWTVSPKQYLAFTAMCDAGQKAISGGWADPSGWGHAYESYPTAAGDGWTTWIYVGSNAPATQSGSVYAVCVK